MIQRRGSHTILLLSIAALLASGCASSLVHREGIDATARIAVVSVVMPRVADNNREGNRLLLQAAVDQAAEDFRTGLTGVRNWNVIDPSKVKGAKEALPSFGTATRGDLVALFPQPAEQVHAREAVSAELAGWKEQFIGAKGLPVIPREALLPDEELTQKDPAVRPVMLQQAGKLCAALQVDAVAFAQVRYTISHPRESAFIVTDERTDGLLALSATLVVVNRKGSVIIDMGLRPVDDSSRSRDLLPLYRGAGKDAVKRSNIDLVDPKKKVARAFTALIDEAVGDLMTELKAELGR